MKSNNPEIAINQPVDLIAESERDDDLVDSLKAEEARLRQETLEAEQGSGAARALGGGAGR